MTVRHDEFKGAVNYLGVRHPQPLPSPSPLFHNASAKFAHLLEVPLQRCAVLDREQLI